MAMMAARKASEPVNASADKVTQPVGWRALRRKGWKVWVKVREGGGFLRALVHYFIKGTNRQDAFHFMVQTYCNTSGYSNEWAHALTRLTRKRYSLPHSKGVLGDLNRSKLTQVVSQLREEGLFVFPQALPPALVDRLTSLANTVRCRPYPLPKNTPQYIGFPEQVKYPSAPTYHFDQEPLLADKDIQNIAADLSFASIAQQYLGCAPVLDLVTMWWSVANGGMNQVEAAQLYHFDMDRLRWLKFIIYLTDVTPNNGPHCFVRGSHGPGAKSPELLKHFYSRLPDNEVGLYYSQKDLLELPAPKGTVLAVDTRAFHKGKTLTEGKRLVLELQYSDCLFGVDYVRPNVTPFPGSALSDAVGKYPKLYQHFVLPGKG